MTMTLRVHQQRCALPRLESHLLWQQVLGVSRAWLIAHDTDPLSDEAIDAYRVLEARRLAGEPMAYILGEREFYGRRFRVTPDVLIPRPETELLVESALMLMSGVVAPRILDLGTGSGVVAVSLALERPDARVEAVDASAAALAVAKKNAQRLGAKGLFLLGNWYDTQLGFTQYDLIVSNPPYIAAQDTHLGQGDLRFEPRMALTDESDGLDDIRILVSGAPARLAANGSLCIEHGWDQAAAVRTLFEEAGFAEVTSLRDLAGIERLTQGRWPA